MNLKSVQKCWLGSKQVLEYAVAGLVAGGHLMIEGPPGTGKTHLSQLLAVGFTLDSRRIQGTPDLMPSDVVGSHVLNADGSYAFHPGPVFTNLLLMDEITRIAPRTLSALLQAMQEDEVTLDGTTRRLPVPFRVIATRSTREVEGVYQLPEAATDRFMVSLRLSMPTKNAEHILSSGRPQIPPSGCLGDLQKASQEALSVKVSERLMSRIIALTRSSREDHELVFGAGIRGSTALVSMCRALAWVRGETAATLDHVEELALSVLSHRLRPVELRMTTKQFVDNHWLKTDPVTTLQNRFGAYLK